MTITFPTFQEGPLSAKHLLALYQRRPSDLEDRGGEDGLLPRRPSRSEALIEDVVAVVAARGQEGERAPVNRGAQSVPSTRRHQGPTVAIQPARTPPSSRSAAPSRLDVYRELAAGLEIFHFIVSDTGIGMNKEQLGRMFQAFTRPDASTTRKFGAPDSGS